MEIGSLALSYLPFVAMIVVAALVVLDARVRIKRLGDAAWAPPLQLSAGILMAAFALGAVILSPDIGLIESADGRSKGGAGGVALLGYVVLAALAVVTLVVGLVRPADPYPRRGLTAVALSLDLVTIAASGWLPEAVASFPAA